MARTEAQAEASRQNGAKGRGPKTPQGKERSSRNSVKHGALAVVHRPPDEPLDLVANVEHALVSRFGLRSPAAREVVGGLARDVVRVRRLAAAEDAATRLERLKIGRTEEDERRLSQLAEARPFWKATRTHAEYLKMLLPTAREADAINAIAGIRSAVPKALKLLGEPILTSVRGGSTIVRVVGELNFEVAAIEIVNKLIQLSAAAVQYSNVLEHQIKEREKERRECESALSELPTDAVTRRLDRYRSGLERSMLRRIEIVKNLSDLESNRPYTETEDDVETTV